MKKSLTLFLIILAPSLVYIFLTKGKHNILHLPYYGERDAVSKVVNGKTATDTVYHTIKNFNLSNQFNESVSLENLENKIIVAEFFFTTCKSICPIMNKNMARVYLKGTSKNKKVDDLVLLSFTVDPAHDSSEVLLEYSKQFNPEKNKWHFLTGNKEEIYTTAIESFLLDVDQRGDTVLPEFIHDEHFVLVDKNKHIRGIYLGTDKKDVDRLIDEINVLRAEEQSKKR